MTQEMEAVHIYHTNDIHSHFDNWPKISRLLLERRTSHTKAGEAFFAFDVGDHVDRSHPFTEGTHGKGNVELLNEAKYDAVTIGNNEGITMSKKALNELYDNAEFNIILGNLLDEDGVIPAWATPYHIYTTEQGTKIGVIGATAIYTSFYEELGWRILPPREQLRKIAAKISSETDIIVCLSHMGLAQDEKLAAESSFIDIILGAHTHHLLPEGKMVNGTLLAAVGKFGDYVGQVTVQFDTEMKSIAEMKAMIHPATHLPNHPEDVSRVNKYIAAGKVAMEEPVFYNPEHLQQNLFSTSPLSSFFGRALIAYTNADCALFNAGIFLGSLSKGWITKADLHALLPHPINLCIITLDGDELLDVYERSLNEDWPEIKIRGLGFRGELMGAIIHERLYKNRHGKLFAGNREVMSGQTYTLATLDMFTFGFFFPLLQNAPKEYCMPDLIRDILGEYGQQYFSE